ncbi:MAG TPA: MFS transporter, partial [Eubacteriaceae bacterium]|nr:MFS transporter [Eubacteriaceae bacterium]
MIKKHRSNYFILFSTLFGAFLSAYLSTSVNAALPIIAREFNVSDSYTSWILTSSLLVTSMTVLPVGKIADSYGRKKILLLGTLIVTITSIFGGLAGSVTAIIIYRSIQGIGIAMLGATVLSIVSSSFPANKRGKAIGINIAATYIGLSASPFISGIILNYINWRAIFFLSVPLSLIILALFSIMDNEWKDETTHPIDFKGSVIYAIGILAVIWGLVNFNQLLWARWTVLLGLLVLLLFGYYETKTPYPLLDIKTIRHNRVLIFSSLASFINYSSTYAISYMMNIFLQTIYGVPPQYVGVVLLVQPAMQALFSPLAGSLSDKMAPRYVASAGMSLISVNLFFLSTLTPDTALFKIVLILAMIGLGFALFSSPNSNSIMSSMNKNEYGVAAAILTTSRTVGQSFSMALTA